MIQKCPASLTCQWHDKAKRWMDTGQTKRVTENRDVLLVLLTRAWRGCTCGLARRVKAAL